MTAKAADTRKSTLCSSLVGSFSGSGANKPKTSAIRRTAADRKTPSTPTPEDNSKHGPKLKSSMHSHMQKPIEKPDDEGNFIKIIFQLSCFSSLKDQLTHTLQLITRSP
jgi:hypothetical protein